MIIIDTSGLLAAIDASEPDHDACREVLMADAGPRILSPFVVAELDALLTRHRGIDASLAVLGAIEAEEYDVAPFDNADVGHARTLMARHREHPMSIANASIVVLADRYDTDRILTLEERLFRNVRPLGGAPSFTLLPADT